MPLSLFFPAQQGSSKVNDTAADNALASERYASARQNYEKSQPMMPTTNDLLKAADNALQTVGREINQLQNK